MPGLGDSEGDLADNALTVVRQIQSGDHAPYAAQLAAKLVASHELIGIILAGHCGGAITSIYAAHHHPSANIVGLMAFEPDFRLRLVGRSEPPKNHLLQAEVRATLLKSPLGPLLQTTHHLLKAAKTGDQTSPSNNGSEAKQPEAAPVQANDGTPPPDANLALLKAWNQTLKEPFPILLVSVPNASTPPYYRDLLERTAPALTHIKLPHTNHAFVEGTGTQDVIAATQAWLQRHYPTSPSYNV